MRVELHRKPDVLGKGASRLVGFGGSDVPGDAFSNLRLEADERRRYDPGESPPAAVVDALEDPTGVALRLLARAGIGGVLAVVGVAALSVL